MNLNERQRAVLKTLAEITTITKGRRKGEVKARIDAYRTYDGRTLVSLQRRGLIDMRTGTIHGAGIAVTLAGVRELEKGH